MSPCISLCAVIVAFNPDAHFTQRLDKIIDICDEVIIVDNSPQPWSNLQVLENTSVDVIHLIENNNNLGIGKALNQGILRAFEMGYTQVITFDQDTIVSDVLRDRLHSITREFNGVPVIVGCNYWNANKKKYRYQCINSKNITEECKTVISSGMLLTKQIVDEIGLFREDYFIDSVDHEYCLRARRAGIKIYYSCESLLHHSIGNKPSTKGFSVLAFNHIPLRKYYMARNTLVTIANYWRTEPLWASKQILRLFAELASIILFETDKQIKLEATWVGLKHAVQGEMGKGDSSLLERWVAVNEN